ncbi:MAG: hypothetical protein J6X56_07445 [Ruminococcus sp.]|uniref:hypothetical protein n=1 Tax=Ruminococcus sp. TaxID=41978 RepID=UPI001B7ADCD7|nr:hypothetical protein [Ruminococcus sp.]MBP5579291.1 hypothetical protein [Ruminococcus sp.]
MKKPLIIGGAVLGSLLAAALVIFIFFPGLPTYLKVKHKYDNIDSRVPEFPRVEIPADYVTHTIRGVTFSAPSDWEAHSAISGFEPSSYRAADEKSMIIAIRFDQSYYDILYSEDAEYDPWEGYDHSVEEYRHFFSKTGSDPPGKWLNMLIIWLARDGFTAKDCLKLRGTDLDVFEELAEIKENSPNIENSWKTSGEGFKAYIGQVTGYGYDGGIWTYTVIPNDSEDLIVVTVKCADETTAKQIISSIELE